VLLENIMTSADVGSANVEPTFTERLVRLKDQFPPELVRWRLMQKPRDGQSRGLAVAYLSMVDIEDHLDNVMGPHRWRCTYPVVSKFVICKIELQDDNDQWIGKEDGAADNVSMQANDDDFDKDTKAVLSDAKKRACRAWGIGRYLATVEKPWVDCEARGRSWIIADYEYLRLAHLVGGPPPPPAQNQQRPAQQPQQQQQGGYDGSGHQGPPPSPRQQPQQQASQQYQGQGGYQNAPPQGQPQQGGKVFKIPGGRSKDTPLCDANEADILFWIDRKSTENNPRFAAQNNEWVAAANAELSRRRGHGNAPAQVPTNQNTAPRQDRPPPPNNGYQQRQQAAPPQQQYQGPPPQDDWHPPGGSGGDDIPF
jgi:hypothetical protein